MEDPAITLEIAAKFLTACDEWQRPVFAAILLWTEAVGTGLDLWTELHRRIRLDQMPELGYQTKGRRDKRVPILSAVEGLWFPQHSATGQGLLFRRRQSVGTFSDTSSYLDVVETYRDMISKVMSAAERQRIRKCLQRELGGVDYDTLEREFGAMVEATRLAANGHAQRFSTPVCYGTRECRNAGVLPPGT